MVLEKGGDSDDDDDDDDDDEWTLLAMEEGIFTGIEESVKSEIMEGIILQQDCNRLIREV